MILHVVVCDMEYCSGVGPLAESEDSAVIAAVANGWRATSQVPKVVRGGVRLRRGSGPWLIFCPDHQEAER